MSVYYNDNDPHCAQWLRNLIDAGELPDGEVDERSIHEVRADDLRGFDQCHFFAGIGGWGLAFRYAGFVDKAWTASCPCQPFSTAGKGLGANDERHLWPELFRLIRECRPAMLFGEQVEAAIGYGWIDRVRDDVESENYAFAASVLPASCAGAPHIGNRIYFVAQAASQRNGERTRVSAQTGRRRASDADRAGWSRFVPYIAQDGKRRRIEPGLVPVAHGIPASVEQLRAYGNAIVPQVAQAFIESVMECMP